MPVRLKDRIDDGDYDNADDGNDDDDEFDDDDGDDDDNDAAAADDDDVTCARLSDSIVGTY